MGLSDHLGKKGFSYSFLHSVMSAVSEKCACQKFLALCVTNRLYKDVMANFVCCETVLWVSMGWFLKYEINISVGR